MAIYVQCAQYSSIVSNRNANRGTSKPELKILLRAIISKGRMSCLEVRVPRRVPVILAK